jgi:hypothetical protein
MACHLGSASLSLLISSYMSGIAIVIVKLAEVVKVASAKRLCMGIGI